MYNIRKNLQSAYKDERQELQTKQYVTVNDR